MVYPAPFHRIVMIGNLYGDMFNTTLSMIPNGAGTVPAVTDDLVEAVGTFIGQWFDNPSNITTPYGLGLINAAVLTSVKVNRIGVDGRYQDPETKEWVLPIPVPGGHASTPAPQLSIAATLRGPNERARAGKGRMYFPPSRAVSVIASDGRLTSADATSFGNGVHALLAGLTDVYLTEGVGAVPGIASRVGSGAFQVVDKITVGRTVDTVRSRRNKIPEDYVTIEF